LRESHHLLAITRDRMIPPRAMDSARAPVARLASRGSGVIEASERCVARSWSNAPSAASRRAAGSRGAGIAPGAPPRAPPETAAQTPAGGSHE
jgi:hypothetical protein